jgi:hypothetical protein
VIWSYGLLASLLVILGKPMALGLILLAAVVLLFTLLFG